MDDIQGASSDSHPFSTEFQSEGPHFLTVLFFVTFVSFFGLAVCFIRNRIKEEKQNRHDLFKTGVPTKAIVTYVGLDADKDSSNDDVFQFVVKWEYNVNGDKYNGWTLQKKLPDVSIGDEISILYLSDKPEYSMRGAKSENGNYVKTGLEEEDYNDKYKPYPIDPETGLRITKEQRRTAKQAKKYFSSLENA